ncbi:MAG TPA: hypothetical protein PK082_01260 [Phycisphaerae bacterium]|nr:hypothetical protein [Phycisphaerae bacterium]
MNLGTMLSGVALMVAIACPVLSAKEQKKDDAPKAGQDAARKDSGKKDVESKPATDTIPLRYQFPGEWGEVARIVQLEPKQQDNLNTIVEQKTKVMEQWDKVNQPRLTQLEEALVRAGENKKQREQVHQHLEMLKKQRATLEATWDARGVALLTPQQKTAWFSQKLLDEAVAQLKVVILTDEQKTKAKDIAEKVAPRVRALKVEDNQPLLNLLMQEMFNGVLSPQQQRDVQALFAKDQDKKDAPKKKKK